MENAKIEKIKCDLFWEIFKQDIFVEFLILCKIRVKEGVESGNKIKVLTGKTNRGSFDHARVNDKWGNCHEMNLVIRQFS